MNDTTQAPTAPPPLPIRTGHRARIVQGIYMAKATIENGDTGMVRLYFKGQSLDHTQKTQGNYSTYMTIRQREEVIQKIEAYWPEFANMITNGTEYVFRPFLTITFECKSGQDTSAVDIVRIEEYRPPNFPPHFNTYDKFDAWFREHGLNTYDAKAVLGNDFAEWKQSALEEYAAQVAVKREQEQAMAKQQTPQAEAPRENLDEWAKRQEADDELHADRGGHWIDNENTRRHIMAWLNEKMEERQAPKGDWRKMWAAKQCNVATGKIHDYTGSRDDFQKSTWSAIERHDKERMALGKMLLDAKLLRDSVWADIFGGQATFWDTVASGATLDDIADKVEAYIEAAKNAPTTNEKAPTGATTPESQSKSAEPPKNGQEAPKTNPVKTQPNGAKPMSQPIKLDESAIRAKYTKKLQGGKEYLEVAGRVLLFRIDHPAESGWGIETELLHADDKGAVFKARIVNNGITVSTGHARATFEKSNNFGGRIFEKAETAALGRALANAGYGTDDVDETEEPAHLADSPRSAA